MAPRRKRRRLKFKDIPVRAANTMKNADEVLQAAGDLIAKVSYVFGEILDGATISFVSESDTPFRDMLKMKRLPFSVCVEIEEEEDEK